ncbi:MAG: iron-sulfur cluster assembly accessory protein [Gammaproteobacteria bacterium]|nr:iron-sulfur cluster assembly accessory protein [Gammaproteobacteria bacterium]
MSQVSFSSQIAPHEMQVSPAAAEQLKALLGSIEENVEGIRIYVSGGGCGGMTYGMTYAENVGPYDKTLEGDGYKIMVDAVALNFLQGCDIDFVENGWNKSFVFNNVFKTVGGTGTCGGCGGGGGGGCG